jgi:hypothetical protein
MRNQLVQPVEQFFNREPGSSSTGGEFARQLGELPLALRVVPADLFLADECPGSLVGFEHAAQLKFPVSPENRVRIDGKINGELPHSRQLIAGRERSRCHAGSNLVDDLAVDRNSAAQVQFELESVLYD